jgi:hypothetical protein
LQRVLTSVTLLGLLVATAAAFAITEHLKLEKSDLLGIKVLPRSKFFSPVCRCATTGRATVIVKLRHTGHVTVTIVDLSHNEVRTIASNVLVHARRPMEFHWDGRTDAGGRAPDGIYHPWVQLPRDTLRFANNIILDTQPPKVLSASISNRRPVFLAGPGRSITIRYSFSGKARAVVYVGRRLAVVGRRLATDKIKWGGKLDFRPLRAGTYVLSIGARDRAGNETPAAERKQVRVVLRYIEVAPGLITAAAGKRLTAHVQTAARRYTWRLGPQHGSRRGKVLKLHAPTTPGTYHLVVTENGHTATAVVRVRRK